MADERQEMCVSCPFHGTQDFRIGEMEKDVAELERCLAEIKKSNSDIKTGQAVMNQKFDNLRYPIWIIFATVLGNLAKWLAPIFKAAASAGGF